jgi:hypothetical protein
MTAQFYILEKIVFCQNIKNILLLRWVLLVYYAHFAVLLLGELGLMVKKNFYRFHSFRRFIKKLFVVLKIRIIKYFHHFRPRIIFNF